MENSCKSGCSPRLVYFLSFPHNFPSAMMKIYFSNRRQFWQHVTHTHTQAKYNIHNALDNHQQTRGKNNLTDFLYENVLRVLFIYARHILFLYSDFRLNSLFILLVLITLSYFLGEKERKSKEKQNWYRKRRRKNAFLLETAPYFPLAYFTKL